jgi:Ca2+-transporting ATPase
MVFSGTAITSGRGLGVVVATGDDTQIGKIATFVAETEDEATPIQKRLNRLGRILGWITIIISAFVFLFIVFFASEYGQLSTLDRILQSFIAAVALAVAAIPEGLPAVVTISLAFGTQRMLRRNALVRKLTSMETLGSVDVICADKTGTLTSGEMMVREIYFDGVLYTVTGHGYSVEGEFQREDQKVGSANLNLILKAGLNCNNAKLEEKGKLLGDPTEGALLVSAYKGRIEKVEKRLHEVPFSSERKMMSVMVEEGKDAIVYTKGAPEIVLGKCSKFIKNGQESSLTEADKRKVLEETSKMATKALRVLSFAYKKGSKVSKDTMEEDLIFIGLQAMMDPPRKGVRSLITKAAESGIDVVMITGDHLTTAEAIAGEIGIKGGSITGENLENLKDEEFVKKVEQINIYARVNPEHKFRIVEALKKKGHLVAMTGDGVNDAPALKRADIGIAMGITGTDVSKEASDMVLLDDQFSTIIAAIEEGRGIFHNIRKFVDYLLSSNVGEVLVVFLALLLFKNIPLTAVMLLWINVVTDGLPAVALGLDPAEKGILNYSPRRFQEQIINAKVWVEILIFGVILTIATLGIFSINLSEGLNEARAAAFMAIIVYELVRLVNIRSDYKVAWNSNVWLLLAIASSIVLQMTIVYIPFLANLFEVSPIDPFDWAYIAVTSVAMFFVLKLVDRLVESIPAFSKAEA